MEKAIGVDFRRMKSVDIVAERALLSFRDECFTYVYSSHLIEHFSHREVKNLERVDTCPKTRRHI
ncbi:MAG: hypothetical protein QW454_04990 [Candidatus Bathyarchaeia archaeon]